MAGRREHDVETLEIQNSIIKKGIAKYAIPGFFIEMCLVRENDYAILPIFLRSACSCQRR